MDQNWLVNLQLNSALIVPTRSLANTLNEQIAAYHIAQGRDVWEAPNIIIWRDYLKQLWQLNCQSLNQTLGVQHLISSQQSALLWSRVVNDSSREEQALTLLNVQQTARAVQRSWLLMHDWRVSVNSVEQDHVADTTQFIAWLESYKQVLSERGLVDEPLLIEALCDQGNELRFPYETLTFYAFDLINSAQAALNQRAIESGVSIEHRSPQEKESSIEHLSFDDSKTELRACFHHARQLIEQNKDCSINVVIHDLQDRQSEVEEIAREVFYPAASPLSVQQNSTVYRFSLGQRLSDWASIETALSVISLLKNRTTSADLSFLLRNQFLRFSAEHRAESRIFDRWLKRQRMRNIMVDQLPELYQQCLSSHAERGQDIEQSGLLEGLIGLVAKRQAVAGQLSEAKQRNRFAALSFTDWVEVFSDWLNHWGWSTKTVGNDLNTVQHQLLNRWQALLEEFAGLTTVQRQAGIGKALELLPQMARDAMFIPKAVASPILISSVLEAVGRPADYCFVLGMNDAFPPPPKNDAFVAQRLLASAGHPDMSADSSFVQANTVMQNLLRSMGDTVISFARQNDNDKDIASQASALFRDKEFRDKKFKDTEFKNVQLRNKELCHNELLNKQEAYEDIQGPAWPEPSRAKGGSKIFENQSNCPFKAFVTHQLSFQTEDEAEFGLDHLDRGNIVHHLLDLVWGKLKTQQNLNRLSETSLSELINSVIERTLNETDLGLHADKLTLLRHERPRLVSLISDWLAFEKKRPEGFTVMEREQKREGQLNGIRFTYIIDRLDMADDGRTYILDYKTGNVNRNDWVGEPIKSPQMPLYAVALSELRDTPVSGIAYASVRQNEHKYIELSDAGVFQKTTKTTEKYQALWDENQVKWPVIFAQLADDFLSGYAPVKPIEDSTCEYCDLSSVCRISQLRNAANDLIEVTHD